MAVEEIFSKLASHMMVGVRFHNQMAQAYNFIGLRGFAMCQTYHYIEESEGYSKLLNYYSMNYHKLIIIEQEEIAKIIPDNWYKYTTFDVDTTTKRTSIKELFTSWIDWERQTKKLYQELRQQLVYENEIDAALKIDEYITDVSKELRHAERELITLNSINYDLVEISSWQEPLYNKYKKKLRW